MSINYALHISNMYKRCSNHAGYKCSVNCIQHETTDVSLHKTLEMLWNTDFDDLYSEECVMSPLNKRALGTVE